MEGSSLVAEDDFLVAELREAFGVGTHGLKSSAATLAGSGPALGWAAPGTNAAPKVGSRIGDFEILGELGRGGMGVVYRARQTSLDRLVALKVLPGALLRGGAMVQRFHREAQAAARLNHANVVPVYAQGEYEGSCYYAMKLIEGVSLGTALSSRPELLTSRFNAASESSTTIPAAPPSDQPAAPTAPRLTPEPVRRTAEDFRYIARLMAGVAEGLAHAHANGVVHRDIKPHNLILGEGQRLHITDFGLARLTETSDLTVTGEVMGTPSYLSPEQVRGKPDEVDHRTDIYSVGVTLYEAISGHRPFSGETRDQILHAIATDDAQSPRRFDPRIPIDLETICLRALERDPNRRYPTAEALAEDLRRFAEGRPIKSRRVGPIERAAKWVNRHRALTAALALAIALAGAGAGWAASVSAARHRESQDLIRSAYAALVYDDYRKPGLVIENIARAGLLGADSPKALLTEAIACLGGSDQAAAIAILDELLQNEPENVEAWYVLAWAYWRDNQETKSRDAFQLAEDLGGPQTAEEWFFRGLAVHFDDPLEAIASYRNANAARALEHKFFPQAVLHIARARNQQMYATRTITGLEEAEAGLQQLVESQHYGAYPYYLLSIANRLAAEVYEGSAGTRGNQASEDRFAAALQWARLGREVDPSSDRPVTAEAECLERMGRFEDAIATRTEAIELAKAERERCEGYHYRWRLHYWLGHLNAAYDDVEYHAGCMPESPYYAHFYPALIHAELGDMNSALSHARALAGDDAQSVLRAATCLRLLGKPQEALEIMNDRIEQLDFTSAIKPPQSEEWVRALFDFAADRGQFDRLEALAGQAETPWKLRGEAHFHAAAMALGNGKRSEAIDHFSKAYRSYDGALNYSFHAGVIFGKLEADSGWPAWIAPDASANSESAIGAHETDLAVRSTSLGGDD